MLRRSFLRKLGSLSGMALLSPKAFSFGNKMKFHFLRHATLVLETNGIRFLIDPMLTAKETMDPVKIARNSSRIPMVPLPVNDEQLKELLTSIDAVVVTHTHRDHWDEVSRQLLRKDIPLICQPSDTEALQKQGFQNLSPVPSVLNFKGIQVHRTGGQHGTGEIGQRMGQVSGFVFEGEKKFYVAGDTIWCTEVEQALMHHRPDTIVLNAGAAQFDQGDPITMNAEDVMKVCRALPKSQVIAVHMETINHCALRRDELKQILKTNKLHTQCRVPNDGDWVDV
jgi:L-ascorbate metabolism protein UlaG (beta-lactamase superfamily)